MSDTGMTWISSFMSACPTLASVLAVCPSVVLMSHLLVVIACNGTAALVTEVAEAGLGKGLNAGFEGGVQDGSGSVSAVTRSTPKYARNASPTRSAVAGSLIVRSKWSNEVKLG